MSTNIMFTIPYFRLLKIDLKENASISIIYNRGKIVTQFWTFTNFELHTFVKKHNVQIFEQTTVKEIKKDAEGISKPLKRCSPPIQWRKSGSSSCGVENRGGNNQWLSLDHHQ